MLHLCLDIGNSFIKAGLFQEKDLVEKAQFKDEREVEEWWYGKEISKAIISNVGRDWTLTSPFPAFFFGEKGLLIPLQNLYKTPQTLGKDRLAAAIGAYSIYPKSPCLVVDMGTCITYDFVTGNGEYLGGAISPGLHMRFQALHHFTARLPIVEPSGNQIELIGYDTESSILSGVVNGVVAEVEKTIENYAHKYPNLKVLLCGGDTQFFESIIKGHIFAFPDLVLQGLNHTLLYNAHL